MNKQDIKTNAEKWEMFFSIHSTLGIYPASCDGVKRSEYQDGWNACLMQMLACYELVENFYKQNEFLAEKIRKLASDEVLWFHPDRKNFEIKMSVLCNDLFWWACADSEEIALDEIESLYERVYDSAGNELEWGAAVWACLHRKMRPQHPVEDSMKKDGAWTDELEALPVRGNTG